MELKQAISELRAEQARHRVLSQVISDLSRYTDTDTSQADPLVTDGGDRVSVEVIQSVMEEVEVLAQDSEQKISQMLKLKVTDGKEKFSKTSSSPEGSRSEGQEGGVKKKPPRARGRP